MKHFEQNLDNLDNSRLISLRALIDKALAKRGISLNVGELGEKLAIDYFNSTTGLPNLLRAPTGSKNVDALSRDGERYSIKSYMRAKKTGTIYPDAIDREKQLFEYLLIVHLNDHYQLTSVFRLSWQQFIEVRAWDKRMNAWYVQLSQKNLKGAEVIL